MLSLNKLIYLNPQPSYHSKTFDGHSKLKLIFIRTKLNKHQIPCLFIKANSDEYLLYFHSNAEDIGTCYEFTSALSNGLNVNVICMEYPGYGIYTQAEPTQQQIEKDAEDVFIYINLELRVPDSKLTILDGLLELVQLVFSINLLTKSINFIKSIHFDKSCSQKAFLLCCKSIESMINLTMQKSQQDCMPLHNYSRQIRQIHTDFNGRRPLQKFGFEKKNFFYPEGKDHNNFNFHTIQKKLF